MVHEVKQGEHLFRIAYQYGFRNPFTIWNDPDNSDLRDLRSNPNVLFPGDQLAIPDREEKEELRSTNQVCTFTADIQPLRLGLVIRDANSDPIPNEQCVLLVQDIFGTQTETLTTDGNGKIEKEISSAAEGGEVRVRGQVYFLKIGDLDPGTEPSGQRARLANLGYYFGEGEDIDEDELRTAVEEFQCDNDLFVDGCADPPGRVFCVGPLCRPPHCAPEDCGPKTQKKLKDIHGC